MYHDGFATTGLRSSEFVHLVLHTGAKVKASARSGLEIADPEGLLEGYAQDRCSAKFHGMGDLRAKAPALHKLLQQWIAAL